MHRSIAFLAVGTELLRGETREGNAAALAERLARHGLWLREARTVADDTAAMISACRDLSREPTLLVISGGLGPTDDDFTRDVLAELVGQPLQEDPQLIEQLQAFLAARGRSLSAHNARQAMRPRDAVPLANRLGTAPGLWLPWGNGVLLALPGVPREFTGLLDDHWARVLQALGSQQAPPPEVTLRVFGLAESDMQARLAAIPGYGSVVLRSLPRFPDIRLKLAARADVPAFEAYVRAVRAELADYIFGEGDADTLAAATLRALAAAGWTVSVAESCTGGLVAHLLTEVPGASGQFLAGVVSYANDAKTELLGVPEAILLAHGAVSEPVVAAMAEGMRARSRASVAVATSGIAGPGGGSPTKPVGTVCMGLATASGTTTCTLHFAGLDRSRWKLLVACTALQQVRSAALQSLQPPAPAPSTSTAPS